MSRLTINKPVSEMSMLELAYNSCYIDEDGCCAKYRDFNTDMDARELVRDLMREFGFWEIDDDEMLSDETFDNEIMENLMYGTKELEGLIALFYRNLWAMAELRERLKHYEDLAEQGRLLELPCAEGKTVYAPSYTYECEYDYECKEERRFKCEEDLPCRHQYKEYMVRKKKFQPQMLAVLGKTVFLTKEEAEKALEEMRESHG